MTYKPSVSIIAVMSAQTVLITGGAGYVGSHVAVELLTAGYTVIVVDNREEAVKGKKA